ncbi:MAG TPA: hypothetical protein VMZ04_06025, partial [Anaerolineae bacterium]|nr:hypothetical protein [Anaerolineae bacterium]
MQKRRFLAAFIQLTAQLCFSRISIVLGLYVIIFLSGGTVSFSQTEIHPFILYTHDDVAVINTRRFEEPYDSWFDQLLLEADTILRNAVSWDQTTVPKEIQAYYAKVLAFAYVFTDASMINHTSYGREAALALYYIPRTGYKNTYFSSDLSVSEAAMFWAEAYDMLKGAQYDFNLEGYASVETTIRGNLKALRDYMALNYSIFSPSIGRDFPSVIYLVPEKTDNHHVKL